MIDCYLLGYMAQVGYIEVFKILVVSNCRFSSRRFNLVSYFNFGGSK